LGLVPLDDEKPDDDLGLAPLEEDKPKTAKPRPTKKTAKPTPATTQKAEPTAGKKQEPAPQPAPAASSLLDDELTSLDSAPLDGLMDDSSATSGGPLLQTAPKRKGLRGLFGSKKKVGRKENVWDSPLILLGGGSLLMLMLVGGLLYWTLSSRSGKELLKLADEDYRAGSYTQAMDKYDDFVEDHSNEPAASFARVRSGLCRLRQATATKTNWTGALTTTKTVLREIGSEPDISEANGELAAMLPAIAWGLAEQARQNTDPALLAQSRDALLLLEKHVPKSSRPADRVAEIEASLALTQRAIDRGKRLEEQVAAMRKAIADGNSPLAYDIRKRLLKEYPRLAEDEKLAEVLLEVSKAQLSAVEPVEKSQSALTDEPTQPFISTTALAQTKLTAKVAVAEEAQLFAIADGAAYALDAGTGKVLWRRFIGYKTDGRSLPIQPVYVSAGSGSDCILSVPNGNELWRVEGATGKILWRFPVGETIDAQPLIAGGKLLLATRAGKLITVDIESGQSPGYVKLPQEVRTAGVVDSRGESVFQPADHSNLFVISLADGKCLQVVHIGHEQGSITAPPVLIGGFLVVAVNEGNNDSRLKVFAVKQNAGDDSDQEGEAAEGLSLVAKGDIPLADQGHVDTAPQISGRRMLVPTDAGFVFVFELAGIDAKEPLVKFAETAVPGEKDVLRYALLDGTEVWLADEQLTRYDIITARKRLDPSGMLQKGSTFDQPPRTIGRAIFTVGRKAGSRGTIVAAVGMDQRNTCWETRLAVPILGAPLGADADAGADAPEGIAAATALGALFELDVPTRGQTIVQKPAFVMPPAAVEETFTDQLVLDGSKLALDGGAGSSRMLVLSPWKAPLSSIVEAPGKLTCSPTAFAGGLLAPCDVGQVFLLDPSSAARRVAPFQPRLSGDQKFQWRQAAVVDDDRVAITDDLGTIYLLDLKDQPQPHLAALTQRSTGNPITSPLAVLGDVVYGVDSDGKLCSFKLPKLEPGAKTVLAGRLVWGPRRVGEAVLLATDDGRLMCLAGEEKPLWNVPLNIGSLAGDPLPVGDSYILATTDGVVIRIDSQTGEQQAKIETNRPLATGPTAYGQNLLLGGHDGCIHQMKQP